MADKRAYLPVTTVKLIGQDDAVAATDEPRSNAVGFVLLWLAALVFLVAVLLTNYAFEFGGDRRLSESASDYLAMAGALFSAWALGAWGLRLFRDRRA